MSVLSVQSSSSVSSVDSLRQSEFFSSERNDFESVFESTPAMPQEAGSFMLTDGSDSPSATLTSPTSIGKNLLDGVASARESGVSYWKNLDEKMAEIDSQVHSVDLTDAEKSIKSIKLIVEFSSLRHKAQMNSSIQMTTIKKAGEDIQQLVRGS